VRHKRPSYEPRSFTADLMEALTALREGRGLVQLSVSCVSNGGPARNRQAKAWCDRVAEILAKYPNLPSRHSEVL
jgi:hypothetical protein